MPQKYSLIIHGGAGAVADKTDTLDSIRHITQTGSRLLANGATALDVVEHCVTLLENDPHFNAGHGAVLDHEGHVELDAAIMDGRNLAAGSVAGVTGIKNPVSLARAVMERSEHVMLIGHGAEQFATTQHIPTAPADYFITPARHAQWQTALASDRVVLDHTDLDNPEKKYGTVGAVAYDTHGDLAAATSTGGIVNKKYGRVGDTPIIGAGTYADNATCAVSATGYGEQFIRTVISKHIAEIIRYTHVDAQTAATQGIEYLVRSVKGLGGVIMIDSHGDIGYAYSTPGMIYGMVSDTIPAKANLK